MLCGFCMDIFENDADASNINKLSSYTIKPVEFI